MKFWIRVAVLAPLLLTASHVLAQSGFPSRTDQLVVELAGVLSSEDEAEIRAALSELHERAGVEAVVVTIKSFDDFGESTIETFATRLFNIWGIGDAARNDGVLILLATVDRQVRIELGSGFGSNLDAKMKTIIDGVMVPAFKSGNLGGGLLAGVHEVAEALGAPLAQNDSPVPSAAARKPPPRGRSHDSAVTSREGETSLMPIVAAVLALLAGGCAGVYFRSRPLDCTHCGSPMRKLNEFEDDSYLDPGQRSEENLKSVNYDVWRCSTCDRQTVRGYRRWFSRYKVCPKCDRRALAISSATTSAPTYFSVGEKEITHRCLHCAYRDQFTEVLPMLVMSNDDDTSSGSWSFSGGSSSSGGGHSSGGGASGRW